MTLHHRAIPFRAIIMCALLPGFPAVCCGGTEKPNIIVIVANDLGYGDLGCYGQQLIRTPHLDGMAGRGIRFTNYYAGATDSATSMRVLLTGLHSGNTSGSLMSGLPHAAGSAAGPEQVPLGEKDVTLPEVLKPAGYATGFAGLWNPGNAASGTPPDAHGFDEWFGCLGRQVEHTHYPEFLWHNGERMDNPGTVAAGPPACAQDLFTEFALDFIQRHHAETFFLLIAFEIPRPPYDIPAQAPYTDMPWTEDEKVHAAMVARLDRDAGRLLRTLEELGIDRRTIVFFCSANGAARQWEGRFDSTGRLRDRKGSLYEGGIRSPMMVHWPDRTPAGLTSDTLWYAADMLPTLAALAGAQLAGAVDGMDVSPAILGGDDLLFARFLYWESQHGRLQQAVRWGNWKAVSPLPGGPMELYDLSIDSSEEDNVARENPDVVEEIADWLRTARTRSD